LKAFVTGATGFVGSHIARVLAEQGAELRLLVRSTSNCQNIEGLKAERAIGDLRDRDSLRKAMAGCDVVFHVAADYRLWVRDPDQIPFQCRGHAGGARGGAPEPCAAGGLHLECGDDGVYLERTRGR